MILPFVWALPPASVDVSNEVLAGLSKEFASFSCASCGLSEILSNVSAPFCPKCGHEAAKNPKPNDINPDFAPEDNDFQLPDESELASVACPNAECGVSNIISLESAASVVEDGNVCHCCVCGEEMAFDAGDDDEFLKMLKSGNSTRIDSGDAVVQPGDKVTVRDAKQAGAGPEQTGLDMADPEGVKNPDVEGAKNPSADGGNGINDGDGDDNGNQDSDDYMTMDIFYPDSDDEVDSSVICGIDTKSVTAGLMGDKIYLQAGDVNLAVLPVNSTTTSVKPSKVLAAVQITLAKGGVAQTIKEYKFQPIKIKLSGRKVVASKVKEEVAAALAKQEEVTANYDEEMTQSMEIAAVGINKNFFKGYSNPIKTALVSELSAMVEDASEVKKIVESVFAAYGESYNESLLKLAKELKRKPADIRDQLVETLAEVTSVDVSQGTAASMASSTLAAAVGSNVRPHKADASKRAPRGTSSLPDRSHIPKGRLFSV